MEVWKKINGFEFYEVSNKGNVRSLDNYINCRGGFKRLHKGKILNKNIGTNGYYYVILPNKTTRYIHNLVAETFIGERPIINNKLADIDHIDNNKLNNDLSNLRYLDVNENRSRGSKGKHKDNHMDKNPKSKKIIGTKDGKVIEEYNCGKEVAIKYNINYSTFKSTLSRYGQIVINDMIYKWN